MPVASCSQRTKCQVLACFPPNPLWQSLCRCLQFEQFGQIRKVKRPRHINIGELRAALKAEARIGRLFPATRYLHLLDSQVALGALVKGRAASPSLNFELVRSLPERLGSRVQCFYGYSASADNPADDPTRGLDVRSPSCEWPAWLNTASQGDFALLDVFLAEEGLHPEQLKGLPDPRELAPDLDVSSLFAAPLRPDRPARPAECLASRLLAEPLLSRNHLLELFAVLPSRRMTKTRVGSATRAFSAGAFLHGGICGLLRSTRELQSSVQVLARFVGQLCPSLFFSTVSILENTDLPPHLDAQCPASASHFPFALSRVAGGRLWILTSEGSAAAVVQGRERFGEFQDPWLSPILFDPRRRHKTEAWRGRRVVLCAYCVRDLHLLDPFDFQLLVDLGFRLPVSGLDSNCSEPPPAMLPACNLQCLPRIACVSLCLLFLSPAILCPPSSCNLPTLQTWSAFRNVSVALLPASLSTRKSLLH